MVCIEKTRIGEFLLPTLGATLNWNSLMYSGITVSFKENHGRDAQNTSGWKANSAVG